MREQSGNAPAKEPRKSRPGPHSTLRAIALPVGRCRSQAGVAQQAADIDRLTRRVTMLMEREAEREADGGSLALGDVRPPHW